MYSQELLNLLRCPVTGEELEINNNFLINSSKRNNYEIVKGIPRFVELSNYSENFGKQWNEFPRTQLDSYSKTRISADRFWGATGWNPTDLKGKLVLDVGCGSGRFAEIALEAGAHVIALDYSNAVEACYSNLKKFENFLVIQADIYHLPFDRNSFDFVYCLGVLQHTPDVQKAFEKLPKVLKQNGLLVVDFYEKTFLRRFLPKFFLRPLTRRMNPDLLYQLLKKIVPVLLKLSDAIDNLPLVGRHLRRLVPVSNYRGIHPLSEDQIKIWALLDTNDNLSARYDNPQTRRKIRFWAQNLDLKDIEILKWSHLVLRAVKK